MIAQKINIGNLWASYSMKYSVNEKWKVYGEAQWRLDNYSSTPTPFLVDFSGRNKVNKVFSIKLQYRYRWVNGERNTQRLAIDGRFKWKAWDKKLRIQYRTRLQVTRVNYNGQIISGWRNKVGIERVFSKKFSVYANYENFIQVLKLKSFIRIDAPQFNKNRYTLGVNYKFKKNEFNAFYRIDQSLNYDNVLIHILGLGITRKLT
tara:strand:- start:20703 stop:21317 length:615 start_codon:yes stop_codon:yes gene_type:complete